MNGSLEYFIGIFDQPTPTTVVEAMVLKKASARQASLSLTVAPDLQNKKEKISWFA